MTFPAQKDHVFFFHINMAVVNTREVALGPAEKQDTLRLFSGEEDGIWQGCLPARIQLDRHCLPPGKTAAKDQSPREQLIPQRLSHRSSADGERISWNGKCT